MYMAMIKKIALLTWGPWFEREVALKSADFFENNLKYEYEKFVFPEQLDDFLWKRKDFDLAIPVFHWEYWEDWKVFALLDILKIPYVFSKYQTHTILLDKQKTNTLVKALWMKIPESYIILKEKLHEYNDIPDNTFLETLTQWVIKDYPIIFKPNKWWSSFFTYKVENNAELQKYLAEVDWVLDDDILIQEYIVWDEYSVPMVVWKSLPILKLEKLNKEDFFDYESKYETEATIKETFPKIWWCLEKDLRNYSHKIYNYFGIKWVSRIDYLVKNDIVYFLEVNTIPWMTAISILPKSWKIHWGSPEWLIEKIILDI